jgi:hypothetical protein
MRHGKTLINNVVRYRKKTEIIVHINAETNGITGVSSEDEGMRKA